MRPSSSCDRWRVAGRRKREQNSAGDSGHGWSTPVEAEITFASLSDCQSVVVKSHSRVLKMWCSMGRALTASSNMTFWFTFPAAFLASIAQVALCLRLPELGRSIARKMALKASRQRKSVTVTSRTHHQSQRGWVSGGGVLRRKRRAGCHQLHIVPGRWPGLTGMLGRVCEASSQPLF